jgi:hypothetical protein
MNLTTSSTNSPKPDHTASRCPQRDDPQRRIRNMISILEGHGYTITKQAA